MKNKNKALAVLLFLMAGISYLIIPNILILACLIVSGVCLLKNNGKASKILFIIANALLIYFAFGGLSSSASPATVKNLVVQIFNGTGLLEMFDKLYSNLEISFSEIFYYTLSNLNTLFIAMGLAYAVVLITSINLLISLANNKVSKIFNVLFIICSFGLLALCGLSFIGELVGSISLLVKTQELMRIICVVVSCIMEICFLLIALVFVLLSIIFTFKNKKRLNTVEE